MPKDTPESQAVCNNVVTRSAIFIVATLAGGDNAADTVRAWCADIAALVRSVGKRVPSGNLTCVCGFGSDAWDTLFGAPRPAGLHPFREFGEGEQCCGFGGTFSVSFPNIAAAMGDLKLDHIRAAKPDILISGDMSCMMHLGGLAKQEGKPIKTMHLVQLLRDALKNAGKL